jgi:hypothetical protein
MVIRSAPGIPPRPPRHRGDCPRNQTREEVDRHLHLDRPAMVDGLSSRPFSAPVAEVWHTRPDRYPPPTGPREAALTAVSDGGRDPRLWRRARQVVAEPAEVARSETPSSVDLASGRTNSCTLRLPINESCGAGHPDPCAGDRWPESQPGGDYRGAWMHEPKGRYLPLAGPRRFIGDLVHFAHRIPSAPVSRTINLTELVSLRACHSARPQRTADTAGGDGAVSDA